jgi:HSP20 family protein
MQSLIRFPLSSYNDSFEDMMRTFFRPARWEGALRSEGLNLPADIRIDVEENDKGFTVKAELPGVQKEDIDVRIEGNAVTISAESKREKDVKSNGKIVRSERYYGKLERAFTLSNELDEGKSEAQFQNGVLELKLMKKAGAAPKKLTVS